jgi:cytochrome c oxidase subunit 3
VIACRGHDATLDGTVRRLSGWSPRREEAEVTAWVGMLVFLAAWTMLFAALFFAYALVRSRAEVWPPPDLPPLPRLVPGLATLGLAGSSLAVDRALRACRPVARRRAGLWLLAGTSLGAVFLALQLLVWTRLWWAGLTPTGGPYPSVFYGLTAIHAAHVLVGLLALAWLARRALGRSGAGRVAVRLWAAYWHFVGAVWLSLFVAVYLL